MPSLKAGLPRSTIAVGCTSPTRPRTTSTETNMFGAYAPSTGTSTTGSLPASGTTRASAMPSRSTVTSAVACWNGMRTWKRAVSPGSYVRFSGSTSMRSLASTGKPQSSSRAST